jgi:hypothetical protein
MGRFSRKEGAARTNPQKGFCSWFQRIANKRGYAPAHSSGDRFSYLAGGKLYKRDHFPGKDQILRLATSWPPVPINPLEAQAAL